MPSRLSNINIRNLTIDIPQATRDAQPPLKRAAGTSGSKGPGSKPPSVSSRPTTFKVDERLGWIMSVQQLIISTGWAHDVRLHDLYWEPLRHLLRNPPKIYNLENIQALMLCGNDVVPLLGVFVMPNIRDLTLILTGEPYTPREGTVTQNPRPEDYYTPVAEFVGRTLFTSKSSRSLFSLHQITIHDPLIRDEDLAQMLSDERLRTVSEFGVCFPDAAGRFTRFFLNNPDAYEMLGGRRVDIDRPIKVWFVRKDENSIHDPVTHDTYVGWGDVESSARNVLLLAYIAGEVRWKNGRYHRLVGSIEA